VNSRRVVILGAGGFIGRHLTRSLAIRHDVRLVLVGRDEPQMVSPRGPHPVRCIKGDFADTALMTEVSADADVVINLVSGSTPRFTPTGADGEARANVIPQIAFLEQMSRQSKARIVFFSSGGAVYGNPLALPASESCPTNPVSLYGLSKLTIEKHLQLFRSIAGLDYTILRLGNVFGPGQSVKRRQGVLAAVLDAAIGDRRFTLVGDGTSLRDYVYIGDVIDAVERVIAAPDASGEIFNIGSGVGATVFDIIAAVEACSGVPLTLERVDASAQEVSDIVLDVTHAAQKLGWRPRVPLDAGIRDTFEQFIADHGGRPGALSPRRAAKVAAG
jgi:UDP-glucose 4-epimerase